MPKPKRNSGGVCYFDVGEPGPGSCAVIATHYTGWGGGEENTQRLLLRPAREAGMAEVGKTELERSRCTGPCGSSHGGCSDGGGALWGPDGMSLMPSTGSSGSRMKNSYHKRGGVSGLALCTCSAICRRGSAGMVLQRDSTLPAEVSASSCGNVEPAAIITN